MVKWRWMVVLVVVVALGVGAYLFLRPTEEKRIRRQFTRLAELGTKGGPENLLTAAGKAKGISSLMADTVTISGAPFGMSGTYDRDQLAAVIIQGRMRFESLAPEFHDLEVTLETEATATAHFTAQLTGEMTGERVREVREIRSALSLVEGTWLIGRIEVVEVLRR